MPDHEFRQMMALLPDRFIVADRAGADLGCAEILNIRDDATLDTSSLPAITPHPGKAIGSGGSTGRPKIIVDPKPRARDRGRRAFAMVGIVPCDVDVFEPYDALTIGALLALEDLGFAPRGKGGAFTASGALRPGGRLPSMTSGGGLSYKHPGAFGLMLLIEGASGPRRSR